MVGSPIRSRFMLNYVVHFLIKYITLLLQMSGRTFLRKVSGVPEPELVKSTREHICSSDAGDMRKRGN